jgi:hypothetical protein
MIRRIVFLLKTYFNRNYRAGYVIDLHITAGWIKTYLPWTVFEEKVGNLSKQYNIPSYYVLSDLKKVLETGEW